jgi:hypothetical protein
MINLFKNKEKSVLWKIDTTYLKPGKKLWCSKGWYEVVKVLKDGVLVVPDNQKDH